MWANGNPTAKEVYHLVELWSLLAVNQKEKMFTAADIQDLFIAVYSPSGSNLRVDEERVMMFF